VRFAIGDATVEIIIDDNEFTLPLSQFLPGCDPELLEACRDTLEGRRLGRWWAARLAFWFGSSASS
jgi:hypothetical protein